MKRVSTIVGGLLIGSVALAAETQQVGLRQDTDAKGTVTQAANAVVLEKWASLQKSCAAMGRFYAEQVRKDTEAARSNADEILVTMKSCGLNSDTTGDRAPFEKASTLKLPTTLEGSKGPDEAELARIKEFVRRAEGSQFDKEDGKDCENFPGSDAVRHAAKKIRNLESSLEEARLKGEDCRNELLSVAMALGLGEIAQLGAEGKTGVVTDADRKAIREAGAKGAAENAEMIARAFGPEVAEAFRALGNGDLTAFERTFASAHLFNVATTMGTAVVDGLKQVQVANELNQAETDALKSRRPAVAGEGGAPTILPSQAKVGAGASGSGTGSSAGSGEFIGPHHVAETAPENGTFIEFKKP